MDSLLLKQFGIHRKMSDSKVWSSLHCMYTHFSGPLFIFGLLQFTESFIVEFMKTLLLERVRRLDAWGLLVAENKNKSFCTISIALASITVPFSSHCMVYSLLHCELHSIRRTKCVDGRRLFAYATGLVQRSTVSHFCFLLCGGYTQSFEEALTKKKTEETYLCDSGSL